MSDVNCPYCDAEQEIDHDDGYGYSEDEKHQQCCENCGKNFAYTTSIMFIYEAEKADCLNGAEHKWRKNKTWPVECTKMECVDCGDRREPTTEEWKKIYEDENR